MYHWNTRALAEDLKKNSVSEKDKLRYFLALLLLNLIVSSLPDGPFHPAWWLVSSSTVLFIMILGMLHCYRQNLKGDGLRFIERFICLAWPLSVKFSLLALLVIFGVFCTLLFVRIVADFSPSALGIGMIVSASVLMLGITFWRMGVHLRTAAGVDRR